MENDAERRLEERLDRWTSDLRDALVRIESKLDMKAQASDVKQLQEQLRAVELDFASFKSKVTAYAAIGLLVVMPAISMLVRKLIP